MWTIGWLDSSFTCYLWQSGKPESADYMPAWVGYSGMCHFKLSTSRNLSISFQKWQRSELLALQDRPACLSRLFSGSCSQVLIKIIGLVTACCGFSLAGDFCSRILFWITWDSVRLTLLSESLWGQSCSLHIWLLTVVIFNKCLLS